MQRSARTAAVLLASALTATLAGTPAAFAAGPSQPASVHVSLPVSVRQAAPVRQPNALRQAPGAACLGTVPPIFSVTACAGDGQAAAVGTGFAHPLQASVTVLGRVRAPGVPVVFTAPSTGPSGVFQRTGKATEVDTTDRNGNATSSTLVANRLAGPVPVTARLGFAAPAFPWLTNVATFHLTDAPGPLARLTLSPANETVTAGSPATTYTAQGFDAFGTPLGDVTGQTIFGITNGTCNGAACASNQPGTQTVTGTDAGKTGTATLTVNAGSLDHLVLTPSTASIQVGQQVLFSAVGVDAAGNSLGAESGVTFTPLSANVVQCSASTCTGIGAGTAVVEASKDGKTGTAAITVTTPPPPTVSILSGSSQTAQVGTAFPTPLTVRVTDAAGSPLSGRTVTFAASGGSAVGTLSATTTLTDATGEAQVNAIAGDVAGPWTVSATVPGGGPVSFVLATAAGPVDHLTMSPSSAGILVGTFRSFAAMAVDAFGNSVGDVTSQTTFTSSNQSILTCSGSTCTGRSAGTAIVTGGYQGKTGTATVTVSDVAGGGCGVTRCVVPPPDPGGGGVPVK